ncbi:MAG TPA: HAMP domain-containing protein, partial [Symbiobacteriaceae bacterium]|nr:HAMP domain-containing protein [Symbiobacteriaceae bacterium]
MRLWWLNPLQWKFQPRTIATLLTWAGGALLVAGIVAWWTISSGIHTVGLTSEQASQLRWHLVVNAAWVTGPFLLICVSAAVLFSRVVVRPLKDLLRAMEQLAAGNLAQNAVPVHSRDEVGQIKQAFNAMSSSLRSMVTTVAGTAEELDGAGRRLQ